MGKEQFITSAQFAERENIPIRTVQYRCKKGIYPCKKEGRDWLIDITQFEKKTKGKTLKTQTRNKELGGNVLVFTNNKGGVGKTTLSVVTADKLAKLGYNTLLIDADGQGNATSLSGLYPWDETSKKPQRDEYKYALHDVFLAEISKTIGQEPNIDINQAIIKAPGREYYVLPSDYRLHSVKFWLLENAGLFTSVEEMQTIWKEHFPRLLDYAIQDIKTGFDFIVIDTPPSLDFETKNALMAGTDAVIPIELGLFEIQGLHRVIDFIRECAKENPHIGVLGIAISRYGPNVTNLDRDLEEGLRQREGNLVFDTIIKRSLNIREATIETKSFFEYWRHGLSKNSLDSIEEFTEELIIRLLRKKVMKETAAGRD